MVDTTMKGRIDDALLLAIHDTRHASPGKKVYDGRSALPAFCIAHCAFRISHLWKKEHVLYDMICSGKPR